MDKTRISILQDVCSDPNTDLEAKYGHGTAISTNVALEAMKIFGRQAYHARAKLMNTKIGWLYIPEVVDEDFDEYFNKLEEQK